MTRGRKFQYNPGDIISHYEMVSRDYNAGNGNWYCTFKCLQCGEIFQARLKNIAKGAQPCSCKKSNRTDLIGSIKGVYTIIDKAPDRPEDRNAYWKCQCICGEVFEISTSDFNRHKHEICPHKEGLLGGRIPKDLVGQRFGKLTVLEYVGKRYWKCRCDCGREIIRRGDILHRNDSCPACSTMNNSRGEKRILEILEKLRIKFEIQKSFDSCRFPDTGAKAKFDFYIPDKNILIEYNGIQHYEAKNSGWNTEEALVERQKKDQFKINWCQKNNISLLIIPYTDFDILDENYFKKALNIQ